MKMSFRRSVTENTIPPAFIRQIPSIEDIVSALHKTPIGEAWTRGVIEKLSDAVSTAGLRLSVIESIAVHEEIKLGAATRDCWLDNYYENIRVVGSAGISVVYYNFMPVFDWIRTDLAQQQPDGSTALAYSHSNMQAMDLSIGTGQLP